MKKIATFLTTAALLVLPFSACDKSNVTKLKITEVTHSVFYAPMYLAEALGYFEEEKIKITLTNGGGADNVMSSVLSGDADIGFCGPEAALYVLIGGSTDVPTVFGQLTKRDGSFLVSRKSEPDFKWEDLKGKEILAGRKGGVPAMTFEYVLNNHSLYDGKNVTMNFDVAFNLMTSAFEAGTADYCTMFEPTASEYQAAGKGYIVASVGEESGEVPYTAYIAKKTWLDKNSDVAEKFLKAVTKATKYLYEHSSSNSATLLVPYFTDTSLNSIITSLESYKKIDAWMTNMAMTEDSFMRLQKIIDNAGELEKYVDFKDLVINDYAENAYKKIYA